jgi:retinoblastoma-like protein 1
MRYYRNQPQAGSHIYRSVFIEYVENESEFVEQQKSQTNQGPVHPNDLRGNGVLHGKESRGDIIHFYNKVFVPKLQEFALKFGSGVPRNDILLSPMPPDRVQNISPKKISLYHDVFISPFLKQDQRNLGNAFTFVFDKSPSKVCFSL